MTLAQHVHRIFSESIAAKQVAADALAEPICRAASLLAGRLSAGGKVLVCGNGGSAGDAQHLSSELLNHFERPRGGYAAIALTTDSSTLTSIANDYDYTDIFARQVLALGRPDDVLVAITTSGASPNIVKAVQAARDRGIAVVALTGRGGGTVASVMGPQDVELRVPAQVTARIQEVHIVVIHCLCDLIDRQLLKPGV